MIISPHEQGSDGWIKDRLGLPTASNFSKIVTSNGEPSKQRQSYLYELAGEAISGKPSSSFKSEAMQMGNDLEGEARETYEMITGNKVEMIGLCWNDAEKLIGASPDGLIGEDGGLEIKSALPHTQIARLEKGWSKAEHKQQIQGNMLVTGRNWWDRISYSPGIKPIIERVERDRNFIDKLVDELLVFTNDLRNLIEKYSV